MLGVILAPHGTLSIDHPFNLQGQSPGPTDSPKMCLCGQQRVTFALTRLEYNISIRPTGTAFEQHRMYPHVTCPCVLDWFSECLGHPLSELRAGQVSRCCELTVPKKTQTGSNYGQNESRGSTFAPQNYDPKTSTETQDPCNAWHGFHASARGGWVGPVHC